MRRSDKVVIDPVTRLFQERDALTNVRLMKQIANAARNIALHRLNKTPHLATGPAICIGMICFHRGDD